MEHANPKCCLTTWLSGFFALGAIVHIVRFFARFSLVVAGREIPVNVSGAVGIVLALLSVGFLLASLKGCCSSGKSGGQHGECCK